MRRGPGSFGEDQAGNPMANETRYSQPKMYADSRLGVERGDLALQLPQNGVVADRHAKRPPAGRVGEALKRRLRRY